MNSTQMKVTMTRLEHGQQGSTFFKDEPGQAPILELHNVPQSWLTMGTLSIKIALTLAEDKNSGCGFKTVRGQKSDPRGLKLRETNDRRHAKQNPIKGDYNAWVPVRRAASANGHYSIPLCKAMMLSRRYQLGKDIIPDMAIAVHPLSYGAANPVAPVLSSRFVVMSKRQPSVLAAHRDPNAKPRQKRNGEMRMKRSDQIKALVSSNKQVVAQYKAQQSEIANLKRQNESMVHLLHQLNDMAKIGQTTQSTDVLACFRICLGTTSTMHWMKKRASPDAPEHVSKKRRL